MKPASVQVGSVVAEDVDVLRRLHRDLVGDAITVGRPHGELVFSGRQRLVDQICALRDLEIRVLGTFLHMEADILPDVQAGEGEIVALDIVLSDRAVRQQNGLIFRATRAEVELRIQARAVLALRVGLEVKVRLLLPVYPIDMSCRTFVVILSTAFVLHWSCHHGSPLSGVLPRSDARLPQR